MFIPSERCSHITVTCSRAYRSSLAYDKPNTHSNGILRTNAKTAQNDPRILTEAYSQAGGNFLRFTDVFYLSGTLRNQRSVSRNVYGCA